MEKYKRQITIEIDLLKGEVSVILSGFKENANAIKFLKNAIKKIENL